ncbi:hypothetical protein [Gimesia aquarii]|uniref:Uncharacterized protein n=1 Tax=Gimesia aquarii TaxID=2527964 RepID=A0A517VP14_9PLAN|nr:hypothetical protein [Gimesia aquarii]QDT94756.1 hypothetical protein V144x_01870 [Gimesia aquarii]
MSNMFNDALDSPGEWFDCLNVGDDQTQEKDDRRKDEDLVIPGFSLVEIVGIRKLNDDHFVHEVRLPLKKGAIESTTTEKNGDQTVDYFVGSDTNFAFTGPGDLLKDYIGRMKFPPALCRYAGDEDDTAKIFGRYKAPERQLGGKFTDVEYEAFKRQEQLFGRGVKQQLLGDPAGHLKLPKEGSNRAQFSETGWDVLGIYKYNTGEKTKGKKDDEDSTKNLLAYVAPPSPSAPPSVVFLTKEDITNQVFQTGSVAVDLLEFVDPRSDAWNHKFLIDFSGVFGHEYEFEIIDNFGLSIGPFLISTDGQDIKAAFENLFWVGKGNVEVYTPGPRTGRFIIEFVGDLAGTRVGPLYWQRIIRVDPNPPGNILSTPEVPPIVQYEVFEYDYKPLSGGYRVQITPASRPLSPYQRWFGSTGFIPDFDGSDWNYGYGYYPGGDYGFFGGWGGGPLGYFGGNYYGGVGYGFFGGDGFYGPSGVLAGLLVGPYDYDADGNPSPTGPFNIHGYNVNGFNKDGFDPGGFDVNGLDKDGKTWAYYGVWGHLHYGTVAHQSEHKNDHGIVNWFANNIFQHTAAGSFGIANWNEGGGYVVVELEQREFWMHVTEEEPTRIVTY